MLSYAKLGQFGVACLRSCQLQIKGAGSLQLLRNDNLYLKNMSCCMNSSSVHHEPQNKYFFIELNEKGGEKDTSRALLEYEIYKSPAAATVMDMYHTEVPPSMQGKGIAQLLAQAAMDYAVANDYKMKLTCTYLQNYIKKNPKHEYTSRLVDS